MEGFLGGLAKDYATDAAIEKWNEFGEKYLNTKDPYREKLADGSTKKLKLPPNATKREKKDWKKIQRRAWLDDKCFMGCYPVDCGIGLGPLVVILPAIGPFLMYMVHAKLIKMAIQRFHIDGKTQMKLHANIVFDLLIALPPVLGSFLEYLNGCSTRNAAIIYNFAAQQVLQREAQQRMNEASDTYAGQSGQSGQPDQQNPVSGSTMPQQQQQYSKPPTYPANQYSGRPNLAAQSDVSLNFSPQRPLPNQPQRQFPRSNGHRQQEGGAQNWNAGNRTPTNQFPMNGPPPNRPPMNRSYSPTGSPMNRNYSPTGQSSHAGMGRPPANRNNQYVPRNTPSGPFGPPGHPASAPRAAQPPSRRAGSQENINQSGQQRLAVPRAIIPQVSPPSDLASDEDLSIYGKSVYYPDTPLEEVYSNGARGRLNSDSHLIPRRPPPARRRPPPAGMAYGPA